MRVCIGGPRDGERISDARAVLPGYITSEHYIFAKDLSGYERAELINRNYRPTMSKDEILKRARAACAQQGSPTFEEDDMKGVYYAWFAVNAVARALRDLDKPLVDPVTERLDALLVTGGSTRELMTKAYEMGRTDGAV